MFVPVVSQHLRDIFFCHFISELSTNENFYRRAMGHKQKSAKNSQKSPLMSFHQRDDFLGILPTQNGA